MPSLKALPYRACPPSAVQLRCVAGLTNLVTNTLVPGADYTCSGATCTSQLSTWGNRLTCGGEGDKVPLTSRCCTAGHYSCSLQANNPYGSSLNSLPSNAQDVEYDCAGGLDFC